MVAEAGYSPASEKNGNPDDYYAMEVGGDLDGSIAPDDHSLSATEMISLFAALAATLLAVFVALLVYLYLNPKKSKKIPGLSPKDSKTGNFIDIANAGSLHQFLIKLHTEFGPMASFWWGRNFTISIATAELFKETQVWFDRPGFMFEAFEPLVTKESIQYANGADGRERRKAYDASYGHHAVKEGIPIMQKVVEDLISKLSSLKEDEHTGLVSNMYAIAAKCLLQFSLGDELPEEEITKFQRQYDACFDAFEENLAQGPPEAGSEREKLYNQGIKDLHVQVKGLIANRRAQTGAADGRRNFLDVLIDSDMSEDRLLSEVVSYLAGGTHTFSYLLVWCLYHLASNPEMQEKAYQEVVKAIGTDQDLTMDHLKNMKYLLQCIEETLRCCPVAPFAARVQEVDGELGGYQVAKGTPIVQALCVSLLDEKVYPEPHKFDPDRFSAEKKAGRSNLAFQPFGFAGGRRCPGYRLAITEGHIFLAVILKAFKITLVDSQPPTVVYGAATKPSEEIWVTLKKRLNG